ncbi:MAG TPA: V-type ATPase 116kDa subunit family protein [Thermoanaerobaculia bacterium]
MSVLRTVPMVHFRVQVQTRDAPAVTRAIAGAGLLHLVDIAHGRSPYETAPPGVADLYAAFRDLRNRVRVASEKLGVRLAEPEGSLLDNAGNDFAAERERIAATLEPIEKRIDQLSHAASAAHERAINLAEQLENAQRLRDAAIDGQLVSAAKFVTIRFALADDEAADALASLLTPVPFAIIPLDAREPRLVAIAVANFARPRLEEAQRVSLVRPIRDPSSDVDQLRRDRDDAVAAEATARKELQTARDELAPALVSIGQKVEIATLLLQAQTFFAAAGRFVVISGWLPAESAARLKEKIRAAAGEGAVVDVERAEDVPGVLEGSMRVPILHRNPLVLRPFQRLVNLYGTPSYGEVQPTAFFAISFLLMFGLMFGDVGHGAILFIAGWSLFRYLPQYLDYGILLMEAGSASMAFGVLYGSVFGVHTILPTLWLEPLHDMQRFMMTAIAIGALIVTTGLVLNVINTWRIGNVKDALSGSRGLFGALLYWVVLVLLARTFIAPAYVVPAWLIFSLAAAAVAVLVAGRPLARRFEHRRPAPVVRTSPVWLTLLESAIELVDTLFSYFANTISFVRVAAFAAVHAGVFIAIFTVADTLAHMRGGGVFSVGVHVAGNALMILLEGLTVSVQVLRLEYYEFFGKFFRGGGEAYVPLMLRHEPAESLGRKHA